MTAETTSSSATRPASALRVADVEFGYRAEPVLAGIDLAIRDGEMVGIVGPNGSGKSTLLRVLAGLLEPRRGEVRLFEKPARDYARLEAARYIAYVAQDLAPVFGYTVAEFVMMGRRPYQGLWPFDNEEDERAAREAMRETETDAFAERTLFELSGGERRRVTIAAALAQEPSILLLDEPTAALDLHYQLQIHDLLDRLNRERSITTVVVTHDLNLAALYCPRVVMLDRGRIIADGPPAEVLTDERLREVYGIAVSRARHPDGTPFIAAWPGARPAPERP